ncbi:MAG: DUF4292 domain-containing protein [Ignavibacteriales bacterium]|nr:MAG: DUF4292 domain-containing protein [Ignavibacteriaceae bacterium]MBW7873529.1 DUF4292 domain-containing protein [Ignavibacteria bacterium]MCZ2142220.1 DUF4292 domain-containing protein [Ignavibacteriales bacterium]OQY76096.1 MAG: hypothetical protein B6D45_04555 [Ignavibacteriales bacterium UTCHB3]MBV6444954.1 hypothetical protein [Ignavibacteriaceae bacterium]
MKKLLFLMMIALPLTFSWQGCATSTESMEDDTEIIDGSIKPERLVKKLEANRMKVRSLTGKGEMFVRTPEIDNSAFFQSIIKRPDSLNVNVYGPFGIELANVLVTEKDFRFYESLNNTLYTGSVDDVALQNIFKVDLAFEDLKDAFAGMVNLTSRLYIEPTEFRFEKGYFYLSYADSVSGNVVSYKIKLDGLNLEQYTIKGKKGEVLLDAKYSDFKKFGTIMLPRMIEVRSPRLNQSLKLNYESLEINTEPVIEFSPPSDATLIEY